MISPSQVESPSPSPLSTVPRVVEQRYEPLINGQSTAMIDGDHQQTASTLSNQHGIAQQWSEVDLNDTVYDDDDDQILVELDPHASNNNYHATTTEKSDDTTDFQHVLSRLLQSPAWMNSTAMAASTPSLRHTEEQRRKRFRRARKATRYLGIDYASYLLKKFRRRTLFAYLLIMAEALSTILIQPFFWTVILTKGISDDNEKSMVKAVTFGQEIVFACLLSALPLGQFVSSSFIGHASDLFGRKAILILSITSSYMILVCLSLVQSRLGSSLSSSSVSVTRSLWTIGVLRFVQGLLGGGRSISSVVRASLSDIGRQDTQLHSISLIAYTTTASSLAQIILLFLFLVIRPVIGSSFFARFDPFVLTCLLGAILLSPFVILVFVMKDSNSERRRADNLTMVDQDLRLSGKFGYGASLRELLDNGQFWILCLLSCTVHLSLLLGIRELMFHAQSPVVRFGMEMNMWGIASLTILVCSGIVFWQMVAFKKLTEWFDLRTLYLASVVLAILSLLIGSMLALPYWFNGMKPGRASQFFVWVLLLLYSLPTIASFVLLVPTLSAMMHLVTLKSQGMVFGTENSLTSLCQVIGHLLSPIMIYVGVKMSFAWLSSIVSLLLLSLSFIIGFVSLGHHRPHKHHVHVEEMRYMDHHDYRDGEYHDDMKHFSETMSDYDRYRYGMMDVSHGRGLSSMSAS